MSEEITYTRAIHDALEEEMKADDSMILAGEDVRYGYISDATKGLVDQFGEERVINTPIAENSIVGFGIGAATRGVTCVVEIMFDDAALLTFDQLMNQAAKIPSIFDGQLEVPLVVRMMTGHFPAAFGPQHSKNLTAMFAHVPGLKVVAPSTPYQAKGYLKTAIDDDGPVAFLEHTRLLSRTGTVPDDEYRLAYEDGIDVAREGTDVAVIASSWMTHQAIDAAESLKNEGVDVKVIDLPVLDPLPREELISEVTKVGRVVLADEGYPRCGVSSDIAALIAEEAIYSLDRPVKRVNASNTPIPANMEHQRAVIPDAADIEAAIQEIA